MVNKQFLTEEEFKKFKKKVGRIWPNQKQSHSDTGALTVTVTFSIQFCFCFLGMTLVLMIMHHHNKFKHKRFYSSEDTIQTLTEILNVSCDLDYTSAIFPQDTLAWAKVGNSQTQTKPRIYLCHSALAAPEQLHKRVPTNQVSLQRIWTAVSMQSNWYKSPIIIIDCFYIALFSAREQTHCAHMWFYMSE